MIRRIGVENFKAFGEYQEIHVNNLTLISGLNSSGKSTIYQVLLLLAQSENKFTLDEYEKRIPVLDVNGDFTKLGSLEEILHDVNKRFVKYVLVWDDGTKVEYRFDLVPISGKEVRSCDVYELLLGKFSIEIADEIEMEAVRIGSCWNINAYQCLMFGEYKIFEVIDHHVHSKIFTSDKGGIAGKDGANELINGVDEEMLLDQEPNTEDSGFEDWTFLPKVTFPNVKTLDFSKTIPCDFVIDFEDVLFTINPKYRHLIDLDKLKSELKEKRIEYEKIIVMNNNVVKQQKYVIGKNQILYLPPFRGYPKRVYTASEEESPLYLYNNNLSKQVYYDYDFNNLAKVKGTLEKAVTHWLVDHFEIAEQIEVNELIPGLISEVYLTISGERIAINNVGFGASQIVPVIFKILISGESKFCIIDEPEIHLHPSVQSKLADFFFAMALTGREVFIETHSDYLMDKMVFLRLKHEEKAGDVSMYWVNKVGKDSLITKIEYDDLGFILNQPDNFLVEKRKLVEMLSDMRMEKL